MAEETIWEGSPSWLAKMTPLWWALAVFTAGIALVWVIMKARATRYRVTTEGVVVQEGLVGSSEDDLELVRLKDVRTRQSALERAVGVGTVTLLTTDATHSALALQGVPNPSDLKEKIRAAANAQKKARGVQVREEL